MKRERDEMMGGKQGGGERCEQRNGENSTSNREEQSWQKNEQKGESEEEREERGKSRESTEQRAESREKTEQNSTRRETAVGCRGDG
jgi:hypothetical protein